MTKFFVTISMLMGLLGCSTVPHSRVSAPSGATVDQKGNVEVPAKVETTTSGLVLPAGTQVVAREDVLEFTVQEPTFLKIEKETLSAAETVAPPSEGEIAAGRGIQVMFYAGIAAILGGLALFGFAHTQSSLWISAGGICLIVAAKVVSMPIFGYLAIGCIGVGAAFFAAWYILKSRDDGKLAEEGLIKKADAS